MLTIDGCIGEGGGQILRSSLALSMCLNTPFRIINIRRARKKPGLRRQHLAAVNAATAVSAANVEGAALGSRELKFIPRHISAGNYDFDIGTAGSTTLVVQTILPALLLAKGSSHLRVKGGTHNPLAPPFDFLDLSFFPLINRMGPRVSGNLEVPGFYPAGGGILHVDIEPAPKLKPIQLVERGEILEMRAIAMLAYLPQHIALRELQVIGSELGLNQRALHLRYVDTAHGPGNVVNVMVRSSHITEVFTSFGERGVRAEIVAKRVVQSVRRYLDAGVPVGEHLADQLLVPLALAGSGSFMTLRPSRHTATNMAVIKRFMYIQFAQQETGTDAWRVTIETENGNEGREAV